MQSISGKELLPSREPGRRLLGRYLEHHFFAVAQDTDLEAVASFVPGHEGPVAFQVLYHSAGQFYDTIIFLQVSG